jgi:hypothetical protein
VSVKTLDRMQVSYFRTAIDGYGIDKRNDGGGVLRGIPIFRAGTFKDSMGEQHTWEVEHLTRMVFHFDMLRDRGILPNVPVRDQHRSLFGGGGTVVGYIEALRVEGEDAQGNALLVADLDITEPDAFGKIERGTWRSRSSEIGYYETNEEAMYWPVMMGLAWVDLPAVEGLFSNQQSSDNQTSFTPIHDQEGGPVGDAKKHNQGGSGETPPAEDQNQGGEPGGQGNPDPSAGNPEGQGQGAPSPDDESSEPGDEAKPEGNGGGEHSAPPAQMASFTINGQPTTDFAAVQRHITNLESVLSEHGKQARRDFVTGLAQSNKIAATQVDQMTAHALTLDESQFEAFTKMYTDAPESPLFANHGQGGAPDEESSRVADLRERVAWHRRSGQPEDKVKATESYKELMTLTDGKG